MAGASLALGAYGAIETAKAGRKAASAADASAQNEALQLEARAKSTLVEGSYNSDRIARKAKQILSSQRARAAASGTDISAIQKDTIQEASVDQLLIMAQAEEDAAKDRYQAETTRKTGKSQADIYRNQARAGLISGASTLIGGVADWRERFA
jgi:hypothetical protein